MDILEAFVGDRPAFPLLEEGVVPASSDRACCCCPFGALGAEGLVAFAVAYS